MHEHYDLTSKHGPPVSGDGPELFDLALSDFHVLFGSQELSHVEDVPRRLDLVEAQLADGLVGFGVSTF